MQYLGATQKCKIEHTPKGWYVEYIDHEELAKKVGRVVGPKASSDELGELSAAEDWHARATMCALVHPKEQLRATLLRQCAVHACRRRKRRGEKLKNRRKTLAWNRFRQWLRNPGDGEGFRNQ